MTYTTQTWTDNVTPVDSAHMTHIESGIATSVPMDAVTAAATRIVQSMLAAGDTQPAFFIYGNGQMGWGPGGASATDNALFRLSAQSMAFGGGLGVGYSGGTYGLVVYTTANALRVIGSGAANPQLTVDANGTHSWGPGNTGADTTLARTGVNQLQMGSGGTLWATGANGGFIAYNGSYFNLIAASATGAALFASVWGDSPARFAIDASGKHSWGPGNSAQDTLVYRNGARQMGTNASWATTSASAGTMAFSAVVDGDTNYRWLVAANGAMNWGPGNAATDTNLYRLGTGYLMTDQSFVAKLDLFVDYGTTGRRIYFGSAGDTNLYRSAAGTLQTDGQINAKGNIVSYVGLAGQVALGTGSGVAGIWLGSATDTNLYRAAAGVLRTDGSLSTGGYGTTLPASPVDGQIFVLVDSTTNPTYQWQFRYNASSASTFKWEFIGGSTPGPALAPTTAVTTSSTAPTAFTGAPTFVLPRAGDYLIRFGGVAYNDAGSAAAAYYYINATDGTNSGPATTQIVAASTWSGGSPSAHWLRTGLPAATISMLIWVTSGTGHFVNGWLEVLPIRVS